MTECPSCKCQRKITCIGLFPVRLAAALKTGASKDLPSPNGVQAWVIIPRASLAARRSAFWKRGLISIWFTAGVTPVSAALVDGTDYTATFNGDPTCSLTLAFLTPESAIGVDQRLIVSYDTTLDVGSLENTALTNIAGATEWFSLDVSDANNLPDGFSSVSIPAQRFAVFTHQGGVMEIQKTFDTIWMKWVPQCGLGIGEGPGYERYSSDFDAETGKGMEIFVPVKG